MAGSPCPVEVMKKVQSRMNMREVTICYGMTETSPVSTQSALDEPAGKRVGNPWAGWHPHVEVKVIDPEAGADRGSRGIRRVVHARIQRDARVLEQRGRNRRRDRHRALDAHG